MPTAPTPTSSDVGPGTPEAPLADAIRTVRRFSRAVTQRVGIFTDRFLGRDRPLGEARLIFEIGRHGCDVRELRARLDLDSGYMSRLLRSLERQGLVRVNPLEADRRIRQAQLTADGHDELDELDRGGDAFARDLLEPLDPAERRRLIEAMAEVERRLALAATAITLEDPAGHDSRGCLEQYFAELAERFDDGFDAGRSISADRQELTPPRGAFLLARLDGRPIGCGALKTEAPGIASIKRMWVSRSARGLGIGRRILRALEAQAAELGFATIRLETNKNLAEARRLYRRNGYREVPAFNDEAYAHHWFEKHLAGDSPSAESSGPDAPE
ncbi:MAG: bifunctional helix-turn-helix transcriptional regulator/GNAT family N-acetyltransferase [Holophagales bacterium]|nr:bifunctional helix-turn-helix transcriptional regulator/GNAT family N-acetyltransferase [Holophagales bacterium]